MKGGLVAEINGTTERQSSLEETVTPAATDRFFTLLLKLRSGGEMRDGHRAAWLHDIDVRLPHPASAERLRLQLDGVQEGDFVRIRDAHLSLPPYASLAPRARYAPVYSPDPAAPSQRPRTAASVGQQRDLKAYLKRLGRDPVLPFVVGTPTSRQTPADALRFFVPARYSGLLDNARLVAGNLTIVGKVTYIDPRPAAEQTLRRRDAGRRHRARTSTARPSSTFAPASTRPLRRCSSRLGSVATRSGPTVRRSVRFPVPIAVILPVAIYQ